MSLRTCATLRSHFHGNAALRAAAAGWVREDAHRHRHPPPQGAGASWAGGGRGGSLQESRGSEQLSVPIPQVSLRSAQAAEVLAEAGANERAAAAIAGDRTAPASSAAAAGPGGCGGADIRGSSAALCADLTAELEAVKAERDALRRALGATERVRGGGGSSAAVSALLRETDAAGGGGSGGTAASRMAAAAAAEESEQETPDWVLKEALLEARRDAERMRKEAQAARATVAEEAEQRRQAGIERLAQTVAAEVRAAGGSWLPFAEYQGSCALTPQPSPASSTPLQMEARAAARDAERERLLSSLLSLRAGQTVR